MVSLERPGQSLITEVRRSSWIAMASLGMLAALMVAAGALDVAVLEPRLQNVIDGLSAAQTAHMAMVDQQTGLRGALLTDDPRFLEAHQSGVEALEPSNAAVGELLASDAGTGSLVLEWRLAQQAWLEGWAAEALNRVGGDDAADVALLEREKSLFDEYRDAYDALAVRLVERREATLRARRIAVRSIAGTALAVTLILLFLAKRRHRRVEHDLTTSMEELLARLERGAALDLAPRGPLRGPPEFQTIADGLESMVAELRRARSLAADQNDQLEARTRQLTEVVNFAHEVAGRLNLRYVLHGACQAAAAIVEDCRVIVWLIDDNGQYLDPCTDTAGPGGKPVGLEAIDVGDGVVGRAGRFGRFERMSDPPQLAVPMVVGARVVGVLECREFDPERLVSNVEEVVEMLAVHAGTAIEAARLHELTETMARTDALTQLPNRRRFDEDLATEVATAERYSRPLALLFVDADHFKAFNDTFGHQAGDVALQRIATTLSAGLRASDTAYRYGGEEFVLLLRECAIDEALRLGERMRARVEARLVDEPRPVTISVGVAALPEHGPGGAALLAAGDAALYAAKRAGRNRVVGAPRQWEGAEGGEPPQRPEGSLGDSAEELELVMHLDPEKERPSISDGAT